MDTEAQRRKAIEELERTRALKDTEEQRKKVTQQLVEGQQRLKGYQESAKAVSDTSTWQALVGTALRADRTPAGIKALYLALSAADASLVMFATYEVGINEQFRSYSQPLFRAVVDKHNPCASPASVVVSVTLKTGETIRSLSKALCDLTRL